MAAPIVYNVFTGWVDVADPQNIPPGTRLIAAADLLRYENSHSALTTRVNEHEATLLELVPDVNTIATDLDAAEASLITQGNAITNLTNALATANTNIAKSNRGVSINSGNVSMVIANRFYIHTGGAATLTLPALTASVGYDFVVKNRGTGTITVSGLEASKMYGTAVSNGLTLAPGVYANFVNDGTFWNRV